MKNWGSDAGPELPGLLEISPQGVVLLEDQQILEANEMACRFLGWDRAQLVGRPLSQFAAPIQPDGRGPAATLQSQIEAALSGDGRSTFVWTRRGSDDSALDTEINLCCRRESGIVHGLGLLRGLSRRESPEPRLAAAHRMELIGQLSGGIAHDFNNLLTAINGNIDMALGLVAGGSPIGGHLAIARSCAGRAGALSRRLLDFSSNRFSDPRNISIRTLLNDTVEFLRPLIRADIALSVECEPKLPPIAADSGQLEQAIINLALNAEDAMPHGGRMDLRAVARQVDAKFVERYPWARPGEYVAVEVEDTGRGIPKPDQSRVFEPFFTSKSREQGTGLGLSVVYGIVKGHQGFIGLESEPGRGTRFWMLFPQIGTSRRPISPPVRHERTRSSGGAAHETILVVEDEPNVRQLAGIALGRKGYRVLEAGSAEEAYEIFEANHEAIDLVVTDMILSGVHGREMVRTLRVRHEDLKILYTSGYDADQLPDHMAPEEGGAFLEKPYSIRDLTVRVAELLRDESA